MLTEILEFFRNSGYWATIDGVVTLCTMAGVWYNYRQNKKALDNIPFILRINGKDKKINVYLLRKYCTRSEIKGILKELDENNEFKIKYIADPNSNFLKHLIEIQQGKRNEMLIEIENSDIFTLKEF